MANYMSKEKRFQRLTFADIFAFQIQKRCYVRQLLLSHIAIVIFPCLQA
jgi:hypothetical protein